MPKHLIRGAIKAIAGIAVVVFISYPCADDNEYRTASIRGVHRRATRLLRSVEALGGRNDENTGYWPNDPKQ